MACPFYCIRFLCYAGLLKSRNAWKRKIATQDRIDASPRRAILLDVGRASDW